MKGYKEIGFLEMENLNELDLERLNLKELI